MKRALVLLACLLVAVAIAVGTSSATVSNIDLSLSESSAYAVVSGSTLYYSQNSGSFTVTATADSDSDSGITSVDFPVVFGSDSASDTSSPYSQTYSWTSSATATGSKTVTVTDADDSGTADFTVTPDTAPTVTDTAPTEITGTGDQYWDSATDTLWFRSAATGSFTLNATAADAETGVTQVAFPDVSGTSGWAGSTGGNDTSSSYSSPVAYTWTAGAGAPGAEQVTATNGTSMTGTDTITLSADSTAPSGQTIALSGGPWFATQSVPLTIGTGTDAGAGVDATRGVVERASAALTNGVCGTFGTFVAVTLVGTADTSVTSGSCYRYQYKATDNVGNVSTASTATSDAKVDSSPPTAPSLLFSGLTNAAASGNVLYYRPGGNGAFTVTAASADSDSGIASYAFPDVPGFTSAGAGGRRTFTFSGTQSAPPYPITVTAVNGAGLTSTPASFTLVADPTPPVLTIRCNGKPCRAGLYPKTVTVAVVATDSGGSGVDTIRYTTDGANPTIGGGAEYRTAFTVGTLTHLKVRAYDKAGNASKVTNVTIRSLADRLAFVAPVRLTVKLKARYVQAHVISNARAKVTAVMTGAGLKRAQRWSFILTPGGSIVQLTLPKAIERPGRYTVVWNVQAGTRRARKTTRVVLGHPKG
jgi:hypothetical protein